MSIAKEKIRRFLVSVGGGVEYVDDAQHAADLGDPEMVEVDVWMARCDSCDWEGNPAPRKSDAKTQLDYHLETAHGEEG